MKILTERKMNAMNNKDGVVITVTENYQNVEQMNKILNKI